MTPGLEGNAMWVGDRLGLVLGSELSRLLGASPGDMLRLMVLGVRAGRPSFRYRSVQVMGSFTTGFSEFDQRWVVTDRAELKRLVGSSLGTTLYEIAVSDSSRAGHIARQVEEILDTDFLVTDWRDLNRELFTALKVQQIALFLVLGLVVLVSTFNIASSVVVLVRERMRDLGVLAALGLSPKQLRVVFLLYGGGLGLVGCLAGVAVGRRRGLATDGIRVDPLRSGDGGDLLHQLGAVPGRGVGHSGGGCLYPGGHVPGLLVAGTTSGKSPAGCRLALRVSFGAFGRRKKRRGPASGPLLGLAGQAAGDRQPEGNGAGRQCCCRWWSPRPNREHGWVGSGEGAGSPGLCFIYVYVWVRQMV